MARADPTIASRSLPLRRQKHIEYLKAGLCGLSEAYATLDASRPWLCYWIVHALEILMASDEISADTADAIVSFLSRCQDPEGGFCGGPTPGHSPHLAPTFAAINSLLTLGTPQAYEAIDRAALRRFLLRMKTPNGAFRMHEDGESDVRGSYCALSVAVLCNIMDEEITRGCAEWICKCQTYEGGIGASPGEEAHGGYTFCGFASLVLLGEVERLRMPQLTYWLVQQQQEVCGGFQGRTNKLVDGCYSFWQGGSFALLHAVLSVKGELGLEPVAANERNGTGSCSGGTYGVMHLRGLLDYLLLCAQVGHGGLRDKPGKNRDYYHTCYGLSGLAVARLGLHPGSPQMEWASTICTLNPLHNLSERKVEQALEHFAKLGLVE